MMLMDEEYLFALVNLVLCVPIVVMSGCRIGLTSGKTTKLMPRITYAILLTAGLTSAFQPVWFGEVPGKADLLVNFALLQLLISGRVLWRSVPDQYKKPNKPDDSCQQPKADSKEMA